MDVIVSEELEYFDPKSLGIGCYNHCPNDARIHDVREILYRDSLYYDFSGAAYLEFN